MSDAGVGAIGDTSTRLLLFIIGHVAEHRRPPVYAEMMAGVGVSRSGIHHHLHRLRDAGLVTFEEGGRRRGTKKGTLRPLVGYAVRQPLP